MIDWEEEIWRGAQAVDFEVGVWVRGAPVLTARIAPEAAPQDPLRRIAAYAVMQAHRRVHGTSEVATGLEIEAQLASHLLAGLKDRGSSCAEAMASRYRRALTRLVQEDIRDNPLSRLQALAEPLTPPSAEAERRPRLQVFVNQAFA